ncbi:hypothetical protein J6590_043022 [Homalodisca vitripennis]|nr:hypothetical protein J6590_043022 [Homalodisca vitripennis]
MDSLEGTIANISWQVLEVVWLQDKSDLRLSEVSLTSEMTVNARCESSKFGLEL